jgi:hypothetical protein
LEVSYNIIIRVNQDPYDVLDASNTLTKIEGKLASGNFTNEMIACNESVTDIYEIRLLKADSATNGLLPVFKETKDLKVSVSDTSANITLVITNMNAIIWVGYSKVTFGASIPTSLNGLKNANLENIFPIPASKDKEILISLTDLVDQSNYKFVFGAEDTLGKNATSIYSVTFKTLTTAFSQNLVTVSMFIFLGLIYVLA